MCSRPVEDLRGKRWDADQLNALLAPDLAADMLDWIDGAFTEAGDSGRFAAFANIADKQLKFDPRKLAPQDAVRRLAKREGRWGDVWERFTASTGFETVVTYLGLEEPGTLFEHSENRDSYPRLNAQGEKNLREALLSLADLSPETATKRIAELDEEHGWRRETVWARRGEAPLAMALSFIAKVAAAEPLPSHDGNALAEAYVTAGADADWAAMCALAAAPRDLDREAITASLRAVYLPWVDAGALSLQELIRNGKVKLAAPPDAEPEATTILFVDGLRMDVARELVRRLEAEDAKVSLDWMWSGFPTVTATCKPMVSPVASMLSGPPTTSDVLPLSPDGKPMTKARALQAHGSSRVGNGQCPATRCEALDRDRALRRRRTCVGGASRRTPLGRHPGYGRSHPSAGKVRTKPPHRHRPWMAADAGRATPCRARRRAGGAERQTNALCPGEGESANLLSSDPLDVELRGLGGDGYGSEVLFLRATSTRMAASARTNASCPFWRWKVRAQSARSRSCRPSGRGYAFVSTSRAEPISVSICASVRRSADQA